MFAAAIHNGWFVAPSHRDVWFRVLALVLMAVGVGLTFLSPAFARNRSRVGPARMAVGLFAVLTALGVGAIAGVVALFFRHSAGDELSVEGILVLASLVMLFGSIFVRSVTREEVSSEFNYGVILAWPAFACMVVDSVGLGYLWLGAQSSSGATRHTGLYLAGFTALVSLALLAEAAAVVRKAGKLPVFFERAVGAAVPAAIAEVAFIAVRGSGDWYSHTHIAGFDLMFGAIVLGVTAYIATLARTGESAHITRVALENAIQRAPSVVAEAAPETAVARPAQRPDRVHGVLATAE